jgi:hypothetical protein
MTGANWQLADRDHFPPETSAHPGFVSAKREYLRIRPETFGDFHLKAAKWSLEMKANAQKRGNGDRA